LKPKIAKTENQRQDLNREIIWRFT